MVTGEGLVGLDLDFLCVLTFTHFRVFFSHYRLWFWFFPSSSLLPLIHFSVRIWNCAQLVSQHNWEREKQPCVCARNKSGSGMLSKNKV